MEEGENVRGRGWVKFDEENSDGRQTDGGNQQEPGKQPAPGSRNSAVINETPGSLEVSASHCVDVESLRRKSTTDKNGTTNASLTQINLDMEVGRVAHDNTGVEQGEVLVTLLPVNERLPWVTPARFRPELVPEELMVPSLTLTVEEYVSCMEKLTTDTRFTLYNILYKRILVVWIFSAFIILLGILFGNQTPGGLIMFGLGVAWLMLNAGAIFFCMWIKLKLNKSLEKCMASVNSSLIKHKLMVALDDRGKISCHKVHLCFLYLDPSPCITYLEKLLGEKPDDRAESGTVFDREAYLREVEGFDDREIVVSGRNTVRSGGRPERAEKLFLHYSQRWAKDFLRRRLDWLVDDVYGRQDYTSNTNPRHIRTALCPCQYIEEHLKNKRQRESINPCKWSGNICQWCE